MADVVIRPITVVLVAYGNPDLLGHALAGVADGDVLPAGLDVHVVDNSSLAQVARIAARHGARYTDPGRNLGFAAAVNVALAALPPGEPRDVLLLNPDAVVSPGVLGALSRALHAPGNDRVAAVAPTLLGEDSAPQRVMWPFPHPARAWLEALGLGRLNRARDFAIGAVLLVRAEAIADVGGFDERFFLYAEETDWQRQARARGWRVLGLEDVVAEHLGGATSSDPLRRERLFHAGAETYVRKWFGAAGWQWYRAAVVVGAAIRAVLVGRRRASATRRLGIYLRGPRRAAGLVGP